MRLFPVVRLFRSQRVFRSRSLFRSLILGLVACLLAAAVMVVPDSALAAPTGGQPRWAWPVGPVHTVVRPFEAPDTQYSAGHRGIDLATTEGAAVLAPADGTVYFAGWVVDRPVLSVAHADGYLSSFEPVTTELVEGQTVTTGQQIGVVSAPAHCESACLHFGVRKDGLYLSPLLFLNRIPRAILLPLVGEGAPARARRERRR